MTSTGFHATEMWRDMIGILHEQVSSITNFRYQFRDYLSGRTHNLTFTVYDQANCYYLRVKAYHEQLKSTCS